MTIQYITLTLQSHKNSTIKLHPQVNYIIGRSRQGKSSILRGLIKLAWNRPIQGMERWTHKHDPENISQVEIQTSDGHTVAWRGSSPQKYIVDGEELSGFGQGVPPAVTEVLNLDELNVSGQHDRAFLLFDTPGEVARTLNRVVGLDTIDKALTTHKSIKSTNDREIQIQESKLAGLRDQEAGFPDLEAAVEFMDQLEGWGREMNGKDAKANGLERLQSQLTELRAGIVHLRVPKGLPERTSRLLHLADELGKKSVRLSRLEFIQVQLGSLGSRLDLLRSRLATEGKVQGLAKTKNDLEDQATTLYGIENLQNQLTIINGRLAYLKPGLDQEPYVADFLTKQAHWQVKLGHISKLEAMGRKLTKTKEELNAKWAIIRAMEQELKDSLPPKCGECPLFT